MNKRPLIANPTWTPEEDDQLRALALAAGSYITAAEARCGGDPQPCRNLGLWLTKQPPGRSGLKGEGEMSNRNRKWSPDDEKRLLDLRASGASLTTIALALQRIEAAVDSRAHPLKHRAIGAG